MQTKVKYIKSVKLPLRIMETKFLKCERSTLSRLLQCSDETREGGGYHGI